MLHLPQKFKMALSKKVFTSNLLPIATLGENLVPENLRFFLQGDLEREAIWPRYGKDRTADGCTGALSKGRSKTQKGPGEKRSTFWNSVSWGTLIFTSQECWCFFLNFWLPDIFWTLCSEGGSGPMTFTQVSWDHNAPGGIALFSLLRSTGAGIETEKSRQMSYQTKPIGWLI